ncbi:helix-turn-helix transcriptional regulator [bacterium]|uniref:Helix-turn-helix transcriptional regulator n=1 Tax=Candidatus Scatenecus faecavium TaxID=2840915 RepID=A0A9D1FUB6_9BACT|nr:helix-turn-helix transcriptional regulator [bacterium]HIS82078.1 helix-turn-helix transcriptional regulator [Candidatus Scatenecus faecavium]
MMIKNRLSIVLGEQRMRVSELSKLTGISQNALNKIYHNKTKGIDFDTLNKLCNTLQINSQELFEFTPD